jgi:hypothetical protein
VPVDRQELLGAAYRLRQSAPDGPSTEKTIAQRAQRNIESFRPVRNAHSPSAVSETASASRVPILLRKCRPDTITGFVVAIIVKALDEHVWRRLAHVVSKIFIGKPPLTDADSASAVSEIIFVVDAIASANHVAPSFIERPFAFAVASAMVFRSARFVVSAPECATAYGNDSSAFAPTIPFDEFCSAIAGKLKDRELTESLSGKVYCSWREFATVVKSHWSLLRRFLVRAVIGSQVRWRFAYFNAGLI